MLEFFPKSEPFMDPVSSAHRRIGAIHAHLRDIASNGFSPLAEAMKSDSLSEIAALEAFIKESASGSAPSLSTYWGRVRYDVRHRLLTVRRPFRRTWTRPLYIESVFPEDHGITISPPQAPSRLTIRHRTQGAADVAVNSIEVGPCGDWMLYVFSDAGGDHRVALCCLPPGIVLVKYGRKSPVKNAAPEESPLSEVPVPA